MKVTTKNSGWGQGYYVREDQGTKKNSVVPKQLQESQHQNWSKRDPPRQEVLFSFSWEVFKIS